MLELKLERQEFYDEEKNEFFTTEPIELRFEHSLVTLSKWESKFEKRFLDEAEKTNEEILGYVECMLLDDIDFSKVKSRLNQSHMTQINAYINAKNSATTFNEVQNSRGQTEAITSELIYYWMTIFKVPLACEDWHLNRLFTFIRVCNLKQQKPKKRSPHEIARERAEINERRKKELNTNG